MLVPVSFEISSLEIPLLEEFLKKHKVEKIKIGNKNTNETTPYQQEMIEKGRTEIRNGKFISNEKVVEKAKLWLQGKR